MSSIPETFTQPAAPILAADTSPARATILLVEDDRSLRRYLEVTLRRAGYEVVTAADGLEAMKMALSNSVDAIVTDAIMPHLNGYELLRFLRRHPKLGALPVLLLSGAERQESPRDAGEGANAYLAKPVRPEELVACITKLLSNPAETRG
ncbi:MAG TPA: response regulator [Pyrinomonadaceae bacterium]|jgi:DNA-binding response OmpR family regulator|nr:response regulator [Pyrinomonadaceae bacterium]